MAKLSVLDMVQDILSDMDSDQVSTISGTLESMQVAKIVKSVYEEMMARKNWPHLKQLISVTPLGSGTPTHMAVPTNIKEMKLVNYDKRKEVGDPTRFEEVEFMYPDEFLEYTNLRKEDQPYYQVVTDPSGINIVIRNDRAPDYYTSFDDENLVFDSFNATLESNLQESKTQAMAYVMPDFTLSDEFVPDLPTELFPALLAEAKSVAFTRIKQMADQKSEQQSRRSMSWASKKAFQVEGGIRRPDYGRRGKKR